MVLIKVLANLHLALSLPYSVITSIHQIHKYSPDCRLFYSFKMNNHLLCVVIDGKNISGQTAIVGNRIDTEAEAAVHFPCWDG